VIIGFVETQNRTFDALLWLEVFFCFVYVLDSMMVLKFIGKERWLKQEVWIFVLSSLMLIDVFSVLTRLNPNHFPFMRALRPAFFAARRRHLNACFVSMIRSMFACLPLLLILMFSVVTFAVIGWIVFDSSKKPYDKLHHEEEYCSTADHGDGTSGREDSCNDYFLTFTSSLYQVWILLVKVNMPDVMNPYYSVSKLSSLYFVIYTVFTQFFFLRLILAASFTNYKRDYEERHRRRLAFKSVAILKAFALLSSLSDAPGGEVRDIVQQPRGRKGLRRLSSVIEGNEMTSTSITLSSWRKMMSIIRPDLRRNPWIYDLIFAASSNTIKTAEQFGDDPVLNYDEFCECCHSVNLKVNKVVYKSGGRTQSFAPVPAVSKGVENIKSFSKWLVLETPFEYIMQFALAILSTSAIICSSDKTTVSRDTIRVLEGCVALLYAVAVLTSIAARGKKFWLKVSNQVAFVVMVGLLAVNGTIEFCDDVTHDELDAVLSMLYLIVVLRSMLFIRFHPEVTATIYTIRLILPMLLRIFVVFMSVMYAFVMVGCSLFENSLSDLRDYYEMIDNNSTNVTSTMLMGEQERLLDLADTNDWGNHTIAWYDYHYTQLKFASFWSAFLLLWQCLLGPNFPVFIEAVAKAHGSWTVPLVYFGVYYVVVVIFVQNVVIAFILEAYISQRKKQGGESLEQKPALSYSQKSWMVRMHRGLNIVLNSDDAEDAIQLSTRDTGDIISFTFSRKPPHHELYDSVFHGDELDPAMIRIKMRVGSGIMRPLSTDLSRPLLSEDGWEEDIADGDYGDEERGGIDNKNRQARDDTPPYQHQVHSVQSGSNSSDVDANELTEALQRRILELEEREKQLRSSLHQALSRRR